MSRRFDEMRAAVDAENRTGRIDALAQEMKNASRAANRLTAPICASSW
jgi:hypothetical protein